MTWLEQDRFNIFDSLELTGEKLEALEWLQRLCDKGPIKTGDLLSGA